MTIGKRKHFRPQTLIIPIPIDKKGYIFPSPITLNMFICASSCSGLFWMYLIFSIFCSVKFLLVVCKSSPFGSILMFVVGKISVLLCFYYILRPLTLKRCCLATYSPNWHPYLRVTTSRFMPSMISDLHQFKIIDNIGKHAQAMIVCATWCLTSRCLLWHGPGYDL